MSGRDGSLAARKGLEDQRRFGREIRALRVAGGQSEEEVAKLAELDRDHYSAIERGEQALTYLTLLRIAAALGVSANEIVELVDS
jgi:XRE family transcriptional regulator, regulator of sulfur utilization